MNLRKTFCTLSGDDFSIIRKCELKIQNRFMAIGIFVSSIFALCFISFYFTFTKLFQNYLIGIPIGFFFSYMIINIYLLLLYTLSKNSFPCRTDKTARVFSIFIRIVFICFIAIIVSKPIEAMLYSMPLESEIFNYKKEQIKKYSKSISEYYDAETKNLKLIIVKQKKLYTNTETSQIVNYERLLQKKETQKNKLVTSMIQLVRNSNYFIQSIVILNTNYRICWLITLFTIFIFLFPAYLKNFLGEQSFYYEKKRTIENRIVKEEYASFKARYNRLFQEHLNNNIQFSEPFIDAPFNTIRKRDEREFLKENDLISDLYNV